MLTISQAATTAATGRPVRAKKAPAPEPAQAAPKTKTPANTAKKIKSDNVKDAKVKKAAPAKKTAAATKTAAKKPATAAKKAPAKSKTEAPKMNSSKKRKAADDDE